MVIDVDECQGKIDRYFTKNGVEIVSKGVYKGNREDFTIFAVAQGQLPETSWFLKVIEGWYTSYFGDDPGSLEYHADALESYYRVKKKTDEYFRRKKGCRF